MKILVQWAKSNPEDWVEVDSEDWHKLAKKDHGSAIDDSPGLIAAVNIQGVEFSGFDHCHVEPIAGRGCRITTWHDDPEIDPVTWQFLPLAPDPKVGGKYNTRQSRVVYADAGSRHHAMYLDTENTTVHERVKWKEPNDNKVRHGHIPCGNGYTRTQDEVDKQYHDAQTLHGWREWTEGISVDRLRDGKVRS